MKTFAGIPEHLALPAGSEIWLQSIPYDGTSTWGKGADKGFIHFLEAADNMELYDIETASEVFRKGIHILPELGPFNSPEEMFENVFSTTLQLLRQEKFLTFFGGEHSVSIGIIRAFYEFFENLTVLQLDAHADLRPEYEGTPYNHACALYDASQNCNLIQVGIRSMDLSEVEIMDKSRCYWADHLEKEDQWMEDSIRQMTHNVYITLDLDVLDPSIMPSTGTPEPGGLDWYKLTRYLRQVFQSKNVVGFDIVELAPIEGLHAPDFLVAKLYYKMLSYKYSS